MPTFEPLMTLSGKLDFQPVGACPTGMRLDVGFTGTMTSPHWEGERPVSGTDFVTVAADGTMLLDIRAAVGEGEEKVAYSASGRGGENVVEAITFETANPDLAFLNSTVAIAVGGTEGQDLNLEIFAVKP